MKRGLCCLLVIVTLSGCDILEAPTNKLQTLTEDAGITAREYENPVEEYTYVKVTKTDMVAIKCNSCDISRLTYKYFIFTDTGLQLEVDVTQYALIKPETEIQIGCLEGKYRYVGIKGSID